MSQIIYKLLKKFPARSSPQEILMPLHIKSSLLGNRIKNAISIISFTLAPFSLSLP